MDQITEEQENISLVSIEAIAMISLSLVFDFLCSIFAFIPLVGTIIGKIIYAIAFALIGSWIFIRSNNLPNSSVGDKGINQWLGNNWKELMLNCAAPVNFGLQWSRLVVEQFVGKERLNALGSLFEKKETVNEGGGKET